MATGSCTEKPVARKHKGQSSPQPNLISKMSVPIAQRKWNDFLAVDYVSKKSLPYRVSKTMTWILRQYGSQPDDDGAFDENTLLLM